jgi:hypothetical protein
VTEDNCEYDEANDCADDQSLPDTEATANPPGVGPARNGTGSGTGNFHIGRFFDAWCTSIT